MAVLLVCGMVYGQESAQESAKSTIDAGVQEMVTCALDSGLVRTHGADAGQVAVMDVKTGHILALSRLERVGSAEYAPSEEFYTQHSSGLFKAVSLLAMLESGNVHLSDTVYCEQGVYEVEGITIKDHNWHLGGYGMLSVEQGMGQNSNIAHVKEMQLAFSDSTDYYKALEAMGFEPCDGSCGYIYHSMGRHKSTQMQRLEFFNAVANGGTVVAAQLEDGEPQVIMERMASRESLDSLSEAMESHIYKGLGARAKTENAVAVGYGAMIDEDDHYILDFCGYVPEEAPRYTIIVTLEKSELPASASMSGAIFKEIADCLMSEEKQ